MYAGRTIFSQVMDVLSLRRFHTCVRRYQGNHKVKQFTCLDQFRVMAFAQLTYRQSLRDIEACLRAIGPKLYHMGIGSRVSRNTLAHANEVRDCVRPRSTRWTPAPSLSRTAPSRKFGISSTMLLSSHYKPDPLPEKFAAADAPGVGASMFPWDVLAPGADEMFDLWYKRMMPYLKNEPRLVSLGTANEPGYSVNADSKAFEAAFREWSKQQYKDIAAANKLWGGQFASFDSITSPVFFKLRDKSQAANYDWLRFVDEKVSAFFQRRKEYLLKQMPGMTVWVKLMGNEHHIGYPHLNEINNILQGQNVAGTDGHMPLWLDLIKSIDPLRPIVNSEWHFLGGQIDLNDQQFIQRRMVDRAIVLK